MAPRILQAVEAAHSESIWSVSWSGDLLATGGNDDTVRVWTVAAGGAAGTHVRPLHTLHGPALGVAAAALSRPSAEAAGAPLLVAGSMDSRVHVWNARSGEALGEVPAGPLEGWAATVAPAASAGDAGSGGVIATGTHDGRVLLHGANAPFARIPREGARGADTGTQKFVMALAFSHDGSMLAAGTANGAVRLVDMTRAVAPESAEDPSIVTSLHSHSKRVRSLCFAPQSSLLLSSGDDGRTYLHDPRDGSGHVGSVGGHGGWVTGVTCGTSASCSEFVTCGADGTVRVWDLGTRSALGVVGEHSGMVWDVAASEDGGMVASVGDDGRLVVFENVRS